MPGTGYHLHFAGIKRAPKGYELHVRNIWGSNQGYLEEHGRIERRYRATDLDQLMQEGLAAISQDSDFESDTDKYLAAIRDATYDAQDAIAAETDKQATAESDALWIIRRIVEDMPGVHPDDDESEVNGADLVDALLYHISESDPICRYLRAELPRS